MNLTPDVVFFCPLPPKPNGIAVYLAEQLHLWAKAMQCCVVIADDHPHPSEIPESVGVLHLSEYERLREAFTGAVHIYHVGNNLDTIYMMPVLHRQPGIVVLHDLNLHHLIGEIYLGNSTYQAYSEALFQQYGRLGYLLGEQLNSHGLKGEAQTQELDFAGSILESALHVIVHSEFSASKLRSYGTNCPITVIPHHLSPMGNSFHADLKKEYRTALNLPLNKYVFTSLGFISEAKQITAMLNVCSDLKAKGVDFLYVLAGSAKQEEYDVFQHIDSRELGDHVLVTGYLSEEAFFQHLHATDFIINLRYPSGGETSGTFTRALGAGKCCVIVEEGPFAEIPDHCAVKLKFEPDFQNQLKTAIDMLISAEDDAITRIGRQAKEWVSQHQDLDSCVAMYQRVVTETQDLDQKNNQPVTTDQWFGYLPPTEIEAWKGACADLWQPLNQNQGLHWWNESLVPIAGQPFDTITTVGGDERTHRILCTLFQYAPENIISLPLSAFFADHEHTRWQSCNNVLLLLDARFWLNDPVMILARINWHCQQGAHIVAGILWSELLEGDIPLDPGILSDLSRAAGVLPRRVVSEVSQSSLHSDFEYKNFEEWYIQGEICTLTLDRFPKPYYAGSYSVVERLNPSYFSDKAASQTTRGDYSWNHSDHAAS